MYVGPGAQNEAKVLGLGLTKLRSYQKDDLERARRYAMEQSVKHVLMKVYSSAFLIALFYIYSTLAHALKEEFLTKEGGG